MSDERVVMWKDRPVTDLSRDELLEVVQWLGKEVRRERESHRQTLEMERLFQDTERAIRARPRYPLWPA